MATENNNKETVIEEFEKVNDALTKSEQFLEDNYKKLLIGIGAVAVVIAGFIYYFNGYLAPKEKEAQEMIFRAEQYFAKDSFDLALNDPDYGFLAVIEEYGMTETADLAKAYAGVCYKNLGKYEEAIPYLKGYDKDDKFSPMFSGAIGDCYIEMGKADDAISHYKKAIASNNDAISPIYLRKLGLLQLEKGNAAEAEKLFTEIKEKYGKTPMGSEAEKFIQIAKSAQ